MKLSFVKNIQGHEIEFVRLMYPLRYELFIKNADKHAARLMLDKDNNNVWTIVEPGEIPGYISEISLSLHEAIEDNESSTNE